MDRITEKLYELSLESGHDEETGSVTEVGFWAAKFTRSHRPGGFILVEDEQGFKDSDSFDTTEALEARWAELVEQANPTDEPAEEDYCISDDRGEYSVSKYMHGHVGNYATYEEALQAIRDDAGANFRPNVWSISDHGNAHLIEDFDWQD